jgi:hypothetical protein
MGSRHGLARFQNSNEAAGNFLGYTRWRGSRLFNFLERFDVGFERRAILVLGLEIGLQLFYKQLEAADFVSQLLNFDCGRRGNALRGSGRSGGAMRRRGS